MDVELLDGREKMMWSVKSKQEKVFNLKTSVHSLSGLTLFG